jgi:hypothetical protein
MNRDDITEALKTRLASGGVGLLGTYPAVDPQGVMTRPYFEVSFPAIDTDGPSLKGGLEREVGRMSVMIVVEFGVGETEANNYADAVKALFPQALRIPVASGIITIQQPAQIRPGYRDDRNEIDWRVPVIIRFSTLSQ